MTGFGRGEVRKKGFTAMVELRSVNSRFLEVNVRVPRTLSAREQEIRDLLRASFSRGSLSVSVKSEKETMATADLAVNKEAARAYYALLNDLRKAVKIQEEVTLQHLLQFSDILKPPDDQVSDEAEWSAVKSGLAQAIKELLATREREGRSLHKDLKKRLQFMKRTVGSIESDSAQRVPEERDKLRARIAELVEDPRIIDEKRLELEVALLAEKLDVTEECVRFRSHLDVFDETMAGTEPAGRKLNFLIQEMNREVNTIGSKVNDASIQQRVVLVKEEMERVREQLQNIE